MISFDKLFEYGERVTGISSTGWEEETGRQHLDFSAAEWVLLVAKDTIVNTFRNIGSIALPKTEEVNTLD